jgi:DUF1009 family protein
MSQRLGLIAGNGRFPILLAQGARAAGVEVIAIGFRGETNPELAQYVKRLHWVGIARIGRWINALKKEGITEAVMAGGITKANMYTPWRLVRYLPDLRTVRFWYHRLRDKKDYTILEGLADELARDGIELQNSLTYMTDHLAREGCCTKRKPTDAEWADVEFGWRLAKEIARLQVGQTVVVKEQAVIAVEAIEGSDEAIRRGGRLGRGGIVVVKVSKPNQDLRFDVPSIGVNTIKTLQDARASVLAVEADMVLMLDKPDVIAAADRAGISIVAIKNIPRDESRRRDAGATGKPS